MLYELLYYLNHDEEREILCIERERLNNMIDEMKDYIISNQ